MDQVNEIHEIIERLIATQLRPDELLVHVEPILRNVSKDRTWQRQIDGIVNDIEITLYTLDEPKRRDMLVEILKGAVNLVGKVVE